MKNIVLIIALFTLIQLHSQNSNYLNEFLELCKTQDTLAQKKLLEKWDNEDPDNPELYTSYFNYYFQKSREEMVELGTEAPEDLSLQIVDSSNAVVGYLGSKIVYHENVLQKAFNYIDEGISKFPDRLDMRFGKIHALGIVGHWQSFTNEIVKTINYAAVNNNNWTWTFNEPNDQAKKYLLSGIQDYQVQLYETGRDDVIKHIRVIALTVLEHYPNHIESLSNIAISYILEKEFEEGLKYLLKAEVINSKDYIVIGNIAYCYKMMGNKEKAIFYYTKNLDSKDESLIQYAKEQIKELQN